MTRVNLTHKTSFYRVGGTTRYAGFLLAVATTGLLLLGTGPIAYIRKFRHLCCFHRHSPCATNAAVIEVGALIFVLGIDLVKEAVWDTWGRASRSEYITIIGIMLCMTVVSIAGWTKYLLFYR